MNLFTKLRNDKHFKKSRAYLVIIFISLLLGAFLFLFYGDDTYLCLEQNLTCRCFCTVYVIIFAFLMFAAFSQLGVLFVIIADTAFSFLLILYSTSGVSEISSHFSIKSIILLTIQIFFVFVFTIIFSEKALISSVLLAGKTLGDKKYFATVSSNFLLFFVFLALLVIICMTAFKI